MKPYRERLQATPVGQPMFHSARLAPYVDLIDELKRNGWSYGEIGEHFALTARQVAYALNYTCRAAKQESELPPIPTEFCESADEDN
jgi:uncharacterized protein (DUF433 family)